MVHELTGLVGQPQNLVSYHLGKLRDARLVSARRSSADGRDAYYMVDLARLRALLATTGAAATGEDDEAPYPAFHRTAAELEARIGFLLAVLANPTTTGAIVTP